MKPEQRRRAGVAVADRMSQLDLTVRDVARKAMVSERTVRSLIGGERWPTVDTRNRICAALGWPLGEIHRRATITDRLADFGTHDLLAEVMRRFQDRHPEERFGKIAD